MKIIIEKNINTEEFVDNIIDDLMSRCEAAARYLLVDAGLDDDAIADNVQKVTDEIFENVLTKLAFEYNKEG